MNGPNKPSWGVIVGRFQVDDLHESHMELIRQVRARHRGVIVFVGVSPAGQTRENPLDFPVRRAMIQAKFPEATVLPIVDTADDAAWSRTLDAAIDSVVQFGDVTLYGGRDSFVPRYFGRFKPVELSLPLTGLKGADIRRELSNRVIEAPEFRAGMIYAAHHLWPVVLQMVDVAVLSDDMGEVALGRRADEARWRFFGGHAEAGRGSLEANARAEAMEECGADLVSLEYVGSCAVDDWRYRHPDRAVMTALFAGRPSSMAIRGGDDVHEARWFRVGEVDEALLVPEHAPLLKLLKAHIIKAEQGIDTGDIPEVTDWGGAVRHLNEMADAAKGGLTRRDVYAFLLLPRHEQVARAAGLGLYEPGDVDLDGAGMELAWATRAAARGRVKELITGAPDAAEPKGEADAAATKG